MFLKNLEISKTIRYLKRLGYLPLNPRERGLQRPLNHQLEKTRCAHQYLISQLPCKRHNPKKHF